MDERDVPRPARPPHFKPRHARKTNSFKVYALSGAAAAVVLAAGVLHTRSDAAAATLSTVTGQVSGLSCVSASSLGHPAGTAWKLTFLIDNQAAEKATYFVHWTLVDSHGTGVGAGTAKVAGVQPSTTATHSGVFVVDDGTTASSQAALGGKMTCKLAEVQRQPG